MESRENGEVDAIKWRFKTEEKGMKVMRYNRVYGL